MNKPQLKLIKGGKIERLEWKLEPGDLAGAAIFGTILTFMGTIAHRAIKGRL